MKQLIWKDAKTIQPLFVAILLGIVVIDLILLLAKPFNERSSLTMLVSFWYLMPNLFALGAPAMLVGTEEDSRTFEWMRTLPVRWQNIANSKIAVAVVGLFGVWIVSSLAYSTLRPSFGTGMIYTDEILRGWLALFVYSFLLLLCGFVTAYWFRSPMVGLLAVIPLIIFVFISIVNVSLGLLNRFGLGNLSIIDRGNVERTLFLTLAGLIVTLLCGMERYLARKRLKQPRIDRLPSMLQSNASAYRPPVSAVSVRPSQTRALLWQAFRQTRWVCLAIVFLTIISTPALENNTLEGRTWYQATAVFLKFAAINALFLGPCWLGVQAFQGDSIGERRRFFADRGISASQVWWTRLFTPTVSLLLIVLAALAVAWLRWELKIESAQEPLVLLGTVIGILSIPFAFGVLSGQWAVRSLMAYLVAPVLAAIAAIGIQVILQFYSDYVWFALLIAPVALFGSWLMMSPWMRGENDRPFHAKAASVCLLAMITPIAAVFAARIATTPAAMPQWRESMLAANVAVSDKPHSKPFLVADNVPVLDESGLKPVLRLRMRVHGGTFENHERGRGLQTLGREEQITLLSAELESSEIGDHVSRKGVRNVLSNVLSDPARENGLAVPDPELTSLCLEVLLQWITQLRQDAITGEENLYGLIRHAESTEKLAVFWIEEITKSSGARPEIKKFVERIPDRDLRRQSRRTTLINAWHDYESGSWFAESDGTKHLRNNRVFGGSSRVVNQASWLPFERKRTDRYVDKITRLLLDQLDDGLPPNTQAPQFQVRTNLWRDAMLQDGNTDLFPTTETWTEEYEQRIDALRKKYADVAAE